MMDEEKNLTRREFVVRSGVVIGAGVLLSSPIGLLAAVVNGSRVRTRGYAAFDTSGKLSPWSFERRAVGDNDILIETKYASICHSDIHQMKGHWGVQKYPQVPGHEIVGIVAAVGKNVTRFKIGDRAGVGCMVNSTLPDSELMQLENTEQYSPATVFTYGFPESDSPTGISQGGYSTNIVVRDHFAVHIPENITFQEAAPLLCAGITTYSPLMKAGIVKGMKVGVAGIGGLGHMAIKLAVSKGAEVYAFTTTPSKVDDILSFGAKEVIVVDSSDKLKAYQGSLDYMISTIPYQFDVAAYASVVKPYGTFTQIGMPEGFQITLNALGLAASRVNFNASMIGGMKETQEVVNYCSENKILPTIQIIKAEQINEAWDNVFNKKARYRYVIDASTM
ncbi:MULTISPECIES: NAD(P)-dependent alcohol dehydrogenase [Klebsiella]|uniref:NAD(P)-dependent alcohol dehydrogenase n=1 Tax=Klebsiella TaxID=570 RepID=UPI001FCC4F54|nr:NAD(P)-dependent alcohol dehydrogenase [Klebsiella variicola]MCJ5281743.1 NAD(P)-dependent alcohol dehydrogenase [Klebsiella variicola]MCJ5304221.1 NAD(P)-dependent alcohol dehydrogenase [Klebsiella variicola]MDZ3702164.1 NAD(P)-dependent alcohol dehydrogenase [Klebsiella variicola]